MNRNQNSLFSKNPQVDIERSRFDRSHSVKLSFNVGDIVPFFCDEVLPGDTFSIDTSKLVRMQTLATPVMDDMFLDTYYFFVPNRLVWSHWKNFMGENTASPWISSIEYNVPTVKAPTDGWNIGTIADYFGIPTGVKGLEVNALPFRAYALIYNEWFRDQNLITPQDIPLGESQTEGTNNDSGLMQAVTGGKPLKAAKFRDYFTSALPSPQKGPDVLLPLGSSAPVFTGPVEQPTDTWPKDINGKLYPLKFFNTELLSPSGTSALTLGTDDIGQLSGQKGGFTTDVRLAPDNLFTDLSLATASNVNQLRLAFAMQRFYERMARGGSRYIEILDSFFGVTSPDSRLQRPEYLGGNRMMINVNQVVQQSETGSTPQGTTAAYSLTTDTHSDFTQSFVEHGFVIGVMVARYHHTYQQGVEKFWSRSGKFDYYWPTLANIGEQPIYNREIYAQGNEVDDQVFGYQEAWADYRYKPNRVAGEMRSSAPSSLDVWHLADDYNSQPYLSADWIQEDKSTVDRCLAVTSNTSNQLFGDFYIKNIATRPMPLFSIPGMIDHH